MLVGIFSDTHLGFGADERFEEAFVRVKECLAFFKEKKVDVIVHAGDLFDEATPSQEVWLKALDAFSENSGELQTYVRRTIRGEEHSVCRGIPLVAIHGTHEHRGKDFANALDILDKSHALIHIHAGNVVFEKNGEKVVIHGLGGVPEKHAKDVLEKYSPKPVVGATNILLLHQSFKEFLPFDEDDNVATLSLGDLPAGFDLIINGHLHWTDEQNIDNKRFLLTGSTIFTQMKNLESQKKKGMFIFDSITKKIEMFPFPIQRTLVYHKLSFKDAKPPEVCAKVEEILKSIFTTPHAIKPLVRIKVTGTLAKGFTQSDVQFSLGDFAEKGIFSISKNFEVDSFEKKIESLKQLQGQKMSVLELGFGVLEKNVAEAKLENFDTRRMFDLLVEGELEKAESVVLGG